MHASQRLDDCTLRRRLLLTGFKQGFDKMFDEMLDHQLTTWENQNMNFDECLVKRFFSFDWGFSFIAYSFFKDFPSCVVF